MGKKYIIELEDKPFELLNKDGITSEKLYRVKGFNSLVFDWNGLQMLTPYTEPDLEQVRKEAYDKCMDEAEMSAYKLYSPKIDEAYQRGLSDAWYAARKIVLPGDVSGIYLADLEEIFDRSSLQGVIKDYSASECIDKIRQYEQEKEEIKVGDEVIPRETEYDTMIVTRLWKDDCDFNCIDAIGFDGRISSFLVSRVSKTGKHYEIAAVLAKMKES